MIYIDDPENTDNVEVEIQNNLEEQKYIEKRIDLLKDLLKEKKIEGYLLEAKRTGPQLLSTDARVGKYVYLTETLTLDKLKVSMYPVWLSIGCTHPKWSRDIMSINLIRSRYNYGEEKEILTDGLVRDLGCSYEESRKLIKKHDIFIPTVYPTDYKLNTNIEINFGLSEQLEPYEHHNKEYHFEHTNDNNMMMSTARVKFIFVAPIGQTINQMC